MDPILRNILLQDMFIGSVVGGFFGYIAYELSEAAISAKIEAIENAKNALP